MASYPLPAADGRPCKYAGEAKAWPISSEPITWPLSLRARLPLALSLNSSSAAPVVASG